MISKLKKGSSEVLQSDVYVLPSGAIFRGALQVDKEFVSVADVRDEIAGCVEGK